MASSERAAPTPARMYDYYLNGKDNYPIDRDAAEKVIAQYPDAAQTARNNRGFLRKATEYIAGQGVDQFIDIGTGFPTSPNVHEIVRSVHPHARIVYVDNDPVVLSHARALLAGDVGITVVEGDMLDPAGILADEGLRAAIDFSRPVAVLFVAVLHFACVGYPCELTGPFRDRMAPGSYLAVSHACADGLTAEEIDAVQDAYRATPNGVRLRWPEEIAMAFHGLELVEPGIVDVARWRQFEQTTRIQVLAGVARVR